MSWRDDLLRSISREIEVTQDEFRKLSSPGPGPELVRIRDTRIKEQENLLGFTHEPIIESVSQFKPLFWSNEPIITGPEPII